MCCAHTTRLMRVCLCYHVPYEEQRLMHDREKSIEIEVRNQFGMLWAYLFIVLIYLDNTFVFFDLRVNIVYCFFFNTRVHNRKKTNTIKHKETPISNNANFFIFFCSNLIVYFNRHFHILKCMHIPVAKATLKTLDWLLFLHRRGYLVYMSMVTTLQWVIWSFTAN